MLSIWNQKQLQYDNVKQDTIEPWWAKLISQLKTFHSNINTESISNTFQIHSHSYQPQQTSKSTVKRGSTILLSHIQFLMRTVSKNQQHCSSSAAGGDKASHPSRYFRSVMCRYDTTVLPERMWRWHHSNAAMTTCHRLYHQRSHRPFHFPSVYIRDFQQ